MAPGWGGRYRPGAVPRLNAGIKKNRRPGFPHFSSPHKTLRFQLRPGRTDPQLIIPDVTLLFLRMRAICMGSIIRRALAAAASERPATRPPAAGPPLGHDVLPSPAHSTDPCPRRLPDAGRSGSASSPHRPGRGGERTGGGGRRLRGGGVPPESAAPRRRGSLRRGGAPAPPRRNSPAQ